ncbi:MAG: YIP1 family protein [Methanoregula sp.]|jgi:hypothetical protein
MTDSFVEKVKGFFLTPVEAFQKVRSADLSTILTYFAILVVINAILSAIVAVFWVSSSSKYPAMFGGAAGPVLVFFIVLVAEFLCTLIFGAWLHLWVYILGGRKGIMQTISSVIHGSTPSLLLGWIPYIGILFTLWSVVLWALGVHELQELSTGKAILAVVIAILIPLILIAILAAYLLVSLVSINSVSAPFNA